MPPVDPALRALLEARTGTEIHAAITAALASGLGPHLVRAALWPLTASTATEGPAWSVSSAARVHLAELDAQLDRALLSRLQSELPAAEVLANELSHEADTERTQHTLALAWNALSPPTARAAASFVDLLRRAPLGTARSTVYHLLVAKGVDPRGPLADDRQLSATERLAVLSARACLLVEKGKLHAVRWEPSPERALALGLSDWSQYATHPRQLVWWFLHEGSAGENPRQRLRTALQHTALPLEVQAWLELFEHGGPEEVHARALGTGRFECGVCRSERVGVLHRRAALAEDPLLGGELEYGCPVCDTRYFSSWEAHHLALSAPATPTGWVVL